MRTRSGFTIIELIIVLAIFAVAIAITLPFLGKFQQSETLNTISGDIVQMLRQTQNKAMTGQRDNDWGVHFSNNQYTQFSGSTYEDRNARLDLERSIPDAFTLGGATDIIFQKLRGGIATQRAIRINGPEGVTVQILINTAGGIFLEEL